MRFLSLRLENWRNFREAHVSLQRRVFLIGANAAGKSNLLDVFRFLQDISNVGGGLQGAVARRQGFSKIRSLAARRNSDVAIEVQIGNEDEQVEWAYRIVLNQDSQHRAIVKEERVYRGKKVVLARPDTLDEQDPERRTQTHLEQVNANVKFRAVSDFFASVKYLHVVPQLIRDPDRSTGRVADPYGGDFLQQIARTPSKVRDSRLRRIEQALKFALPQLKNLKLEKDVRGTPHLLGQYKQWRPNTGWQSEEQFSDGTLRLLGLLWAVLDGTGPLLLEEPELSLNSDIVRNIPQMFARLNRKTGRQIIVSTHSGDLLSDRGIALDEILVLRTAASGTEVSPALADQQIRDLVNGGLTVAEAVLPSIAPTDAAQFSLFSGR